jgi:hypothetical protein
VALELQPSDENRCKNATKQQQLTLLMLAMPQRSASSINTRSVRLATSGDANGRAFRDNSSWRGIMTFGIAAVGEQQLYRHQSEQKPDISVATEPNYQQR